MSELQKYENDGFEGYMCPVTVGGINAVGYIITKTPSEEITVPYCYATVDRAQAEESCISSTSMMNIDFAARKNVIEIAAQNEYEMSEWAENVLAVYGGLENVRKGLEADQSDARHSSQKEGVFEMPDGEVLDITFCYDNPFDEPSFIMTDHPDIDCCYNTLELAQRIVNKNGEALANEKRKESLQKFYEDKIAPLEGLPHYCLTDEQKENLDIFSDRHKDIYGVRPQGIKNHCKFKQDYERD